MAVTLVLLETALAATALFLAVLVLRTGATNPPNRSLATLLAVDGVGWFGFLAAASTALSQGWFAVPPLVADLLFSGARGALAASPWIYLWFVGHALDNPLTRPLRSRTGQRVLLLLAIAVPLLLPVLDRSSTYAAISGYVGVITGGHLFAATYAILAGAAEVRTTGRRGARSYLVSFILRDLAIIALFGGALVQKQLSTDIITMALLVAKSLLLVHLGFLGYALLHGQLPGLDARVHVTLRRSTVVALVAAVFLVLTEGIELLVGIDSPLLSVLGAVVISFSFQPIQGLAERLASRMVPGGRLSTGVSSRDRRSVYREHARVAWADGRLGEKERVMLDQLRGELGLEPEEAWVLEDQVRGPTEEE